MHKAIKEILKRNKRVESDKAWEVSKTRRAIIASITYLAAVAFLWSIKVPSPYLSALIPAAGFLLSTLTLPFFKKLWIEKIYRK